MLTELLVADGVVDDLSHKDLRVHLQEEGVSICQRSSNPAAQRACVQVIPHLGVQVIPHF